MAQKGEKKPLESLKTTAPSPLSVPAPAPESIPGQEHPQGRSHPREERSQGRGGCCETKSTSPGVWRRRALTAREKSFRPGKKLRARIERKEGREEERRHPDKLLRIFQRNRLSTVGRWLPGTQKGRKKLCHDREEKCQKTFRGRADNTKGGVNTGTAHGTGSKTPRQSPGSAAGWIWDHSSSVVGWKKTPNHNIPRQAVLSHGGVFRICRGRALRPGLWGSRTYLGLHNSNTVVSGFETALEIEEGNKSLLHSLTRGVTLPIPPASES